MKTRTSTLRSTLRSASLLTRTTVFLELAHQVHGNRYGYEHVAYLNRRQKVSIVCSIHGDFRQSPESHLSGGGCGKCANKHKTTADFIRQAKKVHGRRYSYDCSEYRLSKVR